MTTHTDVCRRPNGQIVKAEAPPWQQVLIDGKPVDVPRGLLHARLGASDTRAAVVGTRFNPEPNAPDAAGVVNDLNVWMGLGVCHGNQACAIEWDQQAGAFLVCVIDSKFTWKQYLLEPDTLEIRTESPSMPFPDDAGLPEGTSQGFRDLLNTKPSFYDDKVSPAILGGVAFFRPHTRWPFTVGILHSDVAAIWNHTTGKGMASTVKTQLQPRVAIDVNGQPIVAVSTDNGGQFLTLSDFTEGLEPPLPEPDVEPYHRQVPHFAYYTLDADRGYGDYYEQILHACWCETKSDVAKANEQGVYVITNPDLIHKAQKPALVMIANDYQGAPPLEAQIDKALPIARELNIGLLVMDEHDWRTVPANLPTGALCGYKVFREKGQSIDEWMQRAFEIAVRVQNTGNRSAWILGCDDRLNTLNDATIIETLRTGTSLLAELGQVALIGAFSYARRDKNNTTGGGILHPQAWKWIRASAEASDPVVWTDYRLEPEPVEPTEPEEPEEPHIPGAPGGGVMPYVDLNVDAKTLKLPIVLTKVTEIQRDSDKVALKKANGRVVCVTPEGRVEERPADAIGPWEEFTKSAKGYVAERDGNSYAVVTA